MKKRLLTLSMIPMLLLASCGDKNNSSGGSNTPKETTITTSTSEKKADDKSGRKKKEKKQRVFTYNTEDYVFVTMKGYKEGEASLELHTDKKHFFEKVNNDIYDGKATSRQLKQYENAVKDSVTITADKEKELKNGDVITITLEANNEHLIHYCVQFAENTFQYTVHGLVDENGDTDITLEEAQEMYPDAQVIDPFEGFSAGIYSEPADGWLKYMYNGHEIPVGSGTVKIVLGEDKWVNRWMIAKESDRMSLHSPGDKVDIMCDVGMFSFIEDGYILYPTKKEFVLDYMED